MSDQQKYCLSGVKENNKWLAVIIVSLALAVALGIIVGLLETLGSGDVVRGIRAGFIVGVVVFFLSPLSLVSMP